MLAVAFAGAIEVVLRGSAASGATSAIDGARATCSQMRDLAALEGRHDAPTPANPSRA